CGSGWYSRAADRSARRVALEQPLAQSRHIGPSWPRRCPPKPAILLRIRDIVDGVRAAGTKPNSCQLLPVFLAEFQRCQRLPGAGGLDLDAVVLIIVEIDG